MKQNKKSDRGKLMLILFPVSYYLLHIFRSYVNSGQYVCVNRGKQRIKSLSLVTNTGAKKKKTTTTAVDHLS